MYSILNGEIVRNSDGARIPANNNSAHKDYLEWVAQGNTAPDISPIVSAAEQTIIDFESENADQEDGAAETCEFVLKWFSRRNKKLGKAKANKDAMESDPEYAAVLSKLAVSKRPKEAKRLISLITETTHTTQAERDKVVAYIEAKGFI